MIYYPIVVYHTPEDGGYFARVPDLPGCTAHGETPDEAVREAMVAQAMWLEVAADLGRPIPGLPEVATTAGAAP